MASLRRLLIDAIPYKWARRIAVSVIGGTVFLMGVAMIVLPGPALVVIPLGLGILGIEYAWARVWLKKARRTASDVINGVRNTNPWRKPPAGGPPPDSPPPVD